MKPETEPEEPEAISAVSDQKELCERYSAPAPPARTTLANPALCTWEPNVRKTAVNRSAKTAMPHRPTRFPCNFVSLSLIAPPSGLHAAIERKSNVVYDALAFKFNPRTLAK